MSLFNPSGNVKKYAMGAVQEWQRAGNENLSALSPYSTQGEAAFGRLSDLMGINGQGASNNAMSMYQASPGFQYALDNANRSTENSAAARGSLMSGATLKALQNNGVQLANQDYGNYLSRLGALGQMGYAATGAENQARNVVAQGVNQNYSAIGNAQASQNAGYLGAGMNLAGSLVGNLFAPGSSAMTGLGKLFG